MRGLAIAGWIWMLCVGSALAGPDRVSIMLGTHHVGATLDYEEVNPGIFLTWNERLWNNRLDLTVGGYRNSYGELSLAVSTALPIIRKENWGLDLFTALAWYPGKGDRFSASFGDLVPVAGAQFRYENVFLQLIPAGGDSVDATFSFGMTFALD